MLSRPKPGSATGCCMAKQSPSAWSLRLISRSASASRRVRAHIAAAGLPTEPAAIGFSGNAADRLLGHMGKDKKVRDGAITLILPRRIGDVFVVCNTPAEELRAFLAAAR